MAIRERQYRAIGPDVAGFWIAKLPRHVRISNADPLRIRVVGALRGEFSWGHSCAPSAPIPSSLGTKTSAGNGRPQMMENGQIELSHGGKNLGPAYAHWLSKASGRT